MAPITLGIALFAALSAAQSLYDLGVANPSKGAKITQVPLLGLGTWAVKDNATEVVASAIASGYRHVDTATVYMNQGQIAPGIREGLKRAGLKREDIFITTKLWDNHHADPEYGLREGLQQLGLKYVDLWLMHYPIGDYPGGSRFDHVATWRAMEKLVGEPENGGLARYIGVSNFNPQQMKELLAAATIKPKAHQFELHPYLQQQEFVDWHHANNVSVIAYAPLANTNPDYMWGYFFDQSAPPAILANPVIKDIAAKRSCTPAQVILSWNMKRGVAVVPKSSHASRQKENFAAAVKNMGKEGMGALSVNRCVDRLTDEDMSTIAAFKQKGWVRRFNNPCQRMAKLSCFQGLESPRTGV